MSIALIEALAPIIEKLLPLLEKWLSGNDTNATSYNNGNKSLDEFLSETNADLDTLQSALQDAGQVSFDIQGGIHTAQDCEDVITELKAVRGKLTDQDAITKVDNQIAALEKAKTELTGRGETGSPGDNKHIVVPQTASFV
jgi:hypothetical protein